MSTTAKQTIPEAEQRKRRAIEALNRAFDELRDAQNRISVVEGNGSSDLYAAIADTCQTVRALRERLAAMKPIGLFEV